MVIKTKRNIGVASDTNTASFPKDREIFYKCITNQVSRLHRGSDIIDEDGCIYLELCLERRKHGTDTTIGVNPEILGDASFADLFDIFIELGIHNFYDVSKIDLNKTLKVLKELSELDDKEKKFLVEFIKIIIGLTSIKLNDFNIKIGI